MRETQILSSQSQAPLVERPEHDVLRRWDLNPYPGLRPVTGSQVASPISEYPVTTETEGSQDAGTLGERHGLVAPPKPTSAARRQLARLAELRPGWNDTSPVPNETAIWLAARVLDVLEELDVPPSSVVPDAEGGVSIYFSRIESTERYASLSCSNEGDVVALTHDRVEEPCVWSVGTEFAETRAAVERIRAFLLA